MHSSVRVIGLGAAYLTAQEDERWRSELTSITATSAAGSGVLCVPATGEPPLIATRLPILTPFESSDERFTTPVTSTKEPSSFLTSFMMSPLPATRNDLPRTMGPLCVS